VITLVNKADNLNLVLVTFELRNKKKSIVVDFNY